MQRSNPNDRPNAIETRDKIKSFKSLSYSNNKIAKQFEEAYKSKSLDIENNQSTTHPQAIYTSQLLNPYTASLSNIKTDWNENKNDQLKMVTLTNLN